MPLPYRPTTLPRALYTMDLPARLRMGYVFPDCGCVVGRSSVFHAVAVGVGTRAGDKALFSQQCCKNPGKLFKDNYYHKQKNTHSPETFFKVLV
jgi:hypothetical protein